MMENSGKPHKRLNAWQKAIDLTVGIYKLTETFPKTEIYGLTGQMRRASISVASNIAEGAGRQTKKEFINYLHMAQGSLSEFTTVQIKGNLLWASLISLGFWINIRRFRTQVSPLRRRDRRGRFFFCSNREMAIEAETPSLREQIELS